MSEESIHEDNDIFDSSSEDKLSRHDSNFTHENDGYIELRDSPDEEDFVREEITPAFPVTDLKLESVVASESLAVQYLEELFNNGSITGSEMALYKKRFFLLCQLLEKNRESEFNLLQLSKKWTLQVDQDKANLARANDYPDDSNTEVSKMRQDLLKFHNDNLAIEDRLETLNYKIASLEEEKKMLENEMKRLPGLKEKEIKQSLEDSISELKREKFDLKIKNKEAVESSKRLEETFRTETEEFDALCENINVLKSRLVESNSLINQYSKGFEKLRKEISEQSEIKTTCTEQLQLMEKTENSQEKLKMEKEEFLGRLKIEHNKAQNNYILIQSEFDEVKKLLEKAREKETEMKLDKVKLELDMKHIMNEKQRLRDETISKTKSKEKVLKNLKEAKLQLKSNEEALETTKTLHAQAQSNLTLYPSSEISFKDFIEKKKKEIEHRKKLYEVQNVFSEVEKAKVLQSHQEEERLLYDLSDLRIEVVELTRLAQIKADEREQKAKEYILKEKRFNRITDEMKEKILVEQDYKKKQKEIQLQLEDFAKMYNIIQMERNKCANLINTVTHKSSELKEKIRILNNEIQILRTNLNQKEKYVQKQRSKLVEITSIRDSLQSEISKKNLVLEGQKEQRDQIQLDIHRLNFLGNQAEETMVHLRKHNDIALQNRNDRAIQLIERNEEVCILQEKYNIKEEIIKMGEKEIQVRIDEIEFLKQNVKELRRQIKLIKTKIDDKNKLEREAVNLKIQVEICRDQLTELERRADNPMENNRTRILNGKDPSPIDLQQRFEELHIKLSLKEEFLLEKELLLEAVSRLVKDVENKMLSTKTDTVDLAKSINDYKYQMGIVIKKLKAKTAELTMNMSESLKLQQEVKNKDSVLKEVYKKLENGEDIEFEGVKVQLKIQESVRDYEIQQYQQTNGTLTTAKPRPNAYIPDNDTDLPIPRPFGAHAPFIPSEPGSNMRHIRKQKLKPIEI